MRFRVVLAFIIWTGMIASIGCVSKDVHQQVLNTLEEMRKAEADARKREVEMTADLQAVHQRNAKLMRELTEIRNGGKDLESKLAVELVKVATLREEKQKLMAEIATSKEEAAKLQKRISELEAAEVESRKIEADARKSEAETASACEAFKKKTLAELETVHQQKAKLTNELTEAKNLTKDLETKLAVEQVKVATLREEKQKLMTGTTTTKDEIARIQKRMGELETAAVRALELEKRLEERDREIGKLQKAVAERDALNTKVAALMQEREQLKAELQRQREALKQEK